MLNINPTISFFKDIKLINYGKTNYVNAKTEDYEGIIPIYYFSVKNSSMKEYNYTIFIEEVDENDNCTSDMILKRNELKYELTLDNKIIKTGDLDTLPDSILDTGIIEANDRKDYSLKIQLKDDIMDYENKHYHYVVNIKES